MPIAKLLRSLNSSSYFLTRWTCRANKCNQFKYMLKFSWLRWKSALEDDYIFKKKKNSATSTTSFSTLSLQTNMHVFFFYKIEFLHLSNLNVYVYEVSSWILESQPLTPTPYKHLYLWSNHYIKGARWLQTNMSIH